MHKAVHCLAPYFLLSSSSAFHNKLVQPITHNSELLILSWMCYFFSQFHVFRYAIPLPGKYQLLYSNPCPHPSKESESENCSAMSDSLWPHGLYSPWHSPGQNTGVGSLSLLQGLFPIQGSDPGLRFFTSWATSKESHKEGSSRAQAQMPLFSRNTPSLSSHSLLLLDKSLNKPLN